MTSTLSDRTFKCPGSWMEKDNHSRHHVLGLLTTLLLLEGKQLPVVFKETNHHENAETKENAAFILE